jgi:predicted NUDIX family NTP pyrophosphohydrolase
MAKQSAGILLYRRNKDQLEILLVHPGGPFWAKKDRGAWSIPKGEYEGEDPLAAAKREFEEETGSPIKGQTLALSQQKQKGGKLVNAWAVEGDLNPEQVRSNTFEMEWPPKSGRKQQFPEIDKAKWFPVETALEKINPGQTPFIHELIQKLEIHPHNGTN